MYHPTEEDLEERDLSNANDWPFPFYISSTYLQEIAELVEISRSTIPTSHFESVFTDPISGKAHGYRGVDNIEALLYLIPTLFVPRLQHERSKKPILALCKAASLMLKWQINANDLSLIERCLKKWFDFLKEEIENKHIIPSIMRPNMHLLYHVTYIIRSMGCLRSFSAR
ncbi:hypothetical protein, partial, partial [Parasitella parasitica]